MLLDAYFSENTSVTISLLNTTAPNAITAPANEHKRTERSSIPVACLRFPSASKETIVG